MRDDMFSHTCMACLTSCYATFTLYPLAVGRQWDIYDGTESVFIHSLSLFLCGPAFTQLCESAVHTEPEGHREGERERERERGRKRERGGERVGERGKRLQGRGREREQREIQEASESERKDERGDRENERTGQHRVN